MATGLFVASCSKTPMHGRGWGGPGFPIPLVYPVYAHLQGAWGSPRMDSPEPWGIGVKAQGPMCCL